MRLRMPQHRRRIRETARARDALGAALERLQLMRDAARTVGIGKWVMSVIWPTP